MNQETYDTHARQLPVQNLSPGIYTIRIKALGEGPYTKNSPYSETFYYTVYPDSLNAIEMLLRQFAMQQVID